MIAGTPCRATRVALHVSQLISWILQRFAGVAPVSRYTPKKASHRNFASEKVSRYTGVSQLQLRVSRYTVQLSLFCVQHCYKRWFEFRPEIEFPHSLSASSSQESPRQTKPKKGPK